MKDKKTLISLILSLVVILVLAYRHLELRQNYINLESQIKHEITDHLGSSLAFANRIDLNKIATGDKNSILNMMYMYENISSLDAILTTTYYGRITLIDPLIMYDYKRILREIVDKSMKGQLSSEDINNISLINEDLKQIYEYVSESKELSDKKCIKELEPRLKIYQAKKEK